MRHAPSPVGLLEGATCLTRPCVPVKQGDMCGIGICVPGTWECRVDRKLQSAVCCSEGLCPCAIR